MEPHNYFAPRKAPARFSPLRNTASVPGAYPSQAQSEQASQGDSISTVPTEQATTVVDSQSEVTAETLLDEEPPMLKAPHPLSPVKRRNSQGPGASIGESSTAGQHSGALPKRVKPDTAPPKVLPVRYELCAIEDIVVLIANMLSELIETNDALAMRSGHLTRFHSRTAPGISVLDYLHRLAKHATLPPPLLLSMVYYIDRLCALYPDFTINTLTVHRFLITAATVAAKGLSDSFWNNSTYARVGGVRVAELKLLELEFLHRVDWKIVPDPEVLVAYYRGLVQRSPAYVLEDEVDHEDEDGSTEISDEADEDIEEVDNARLDPPACRAASAVYAEARTANIYIQPLGSSSSPVLLAGLTYDSSAPDTASSTSVTSYEAPELPDSTDLVRVGIYDANQKQWAGSTSVASAENFGKGYSPHFVLSVDGTSGEEVVLGASGKKVEKEEKTFLQKFVTVPYPSLEATRVVVPHLSHQANYTVKVLVDDRYRNVASDGRWWRTDLASLGDGARMEVSRFYSTRS
ncbi:putative nuc-1 negative regulatory protein preg [Diaporthe ampelina]|uniref:Putative nuc-1 negative regulatory protein preg n=1 Tax=Diaporthe ampelina TaxID=1214573 RepID=A0A0G2FVB4_9PEZI|nr:putative nuc-1 negative regulatory protein preg [Diaporthe ampelina]